MSRKWMVVYSLLWLTLWLLTWKNDALPLYLRIVIWVILIFGTPGWFDWKSAKNDDTDGEEER